MLPVSARHVVVPPAPQRQLLVPVRNMKKLGRSSVGTFPHQYELNDFLAKPWTGVQQVFRLTRTVQQKGQTRQEVVHGLSNLSPAQASADRLLALVRQHWAIEIV